MSFSNLIDSLSAYFDRHPEQTFLVKSAMIIVGLLFIKDLIYIPFKSLFIPFLFGPVFYWIFLRISPDEGGKSSVRRFLENITFIPAPVTEGEWQREGVAWLTYLLVVINVFIYYLIQLPYVEFVRHNLICLPYRPETWNLIVSPFSSMFLHGSTGHLWGNRFFLWAFGTGLERRIGWSSFLLVYLASGLISCLGFLNVIGWGMGRYAHLMGASGAISGIMGAYAVRCYFKTLQVPVPLLGLLSLFYPLYLKVRINALALVGLYFLLNLNSGVSVLFGTKFSSTAYFAHVFGMLAGIGFGYMLKLSGAAIEERHLDIGLKPCAAGFGMEDKRRAIRTALKQNPNNIEAELELARIQSSERLTEEGRGLYMQVVCKLMKIDQNRAAEVFREYLNRYWLSCDPELQFRISGIFARQGDLVMAARCLNMLVEDQSLSEGMRAKAMFHEGKLLFEMGQEFAARDYIEQFIERFPESFLIEKARRFLG